VRRSPKRWVGLVAGATAAACALFAASASAETLSLSQAIEMGVQNNPGVRAAKARTTAADAQTTIARAGYLPNLSVEGGAIVSGNGFDGSLPTRAPPPLPPEIASSNVAYQYGGIATARVNWNLWDFGKTSNSVASADANLDATAANQREIASTTAGTIAQSYLTLYYQERLFEVATATLATRDKLAAITRGLVQSKILPPMEEIRSSSRLEAARRDMERAKAGVDDARTQLAITLGMDPNAPLKLSQPKLAQAPLDPTGAVKEAESKRAALTASERALESRRADSDAATSQFMPTLLVTSFGTMTFEHEDPLDFRQNRRSGQAQLLLRENFDFSLFARVSQAKANEAAAEADLEATRRDVRSDAVRASISVRATTAQLEHAKKAEEGSQAVRAIVEARYIRGLSSPLELVDAEDADIDARVTRIQTELDHSLAVVRLCIATGRPIAEEGTP
jgi:outer membrane protein